MRNVFVDQIKNLKNVMEHSLKKEDEIKIDFKVKNKNEFFKIYVSVIFFY
jgi:hypothetical protein